MRSPFATTISHVGAALAMLLSATGCRTSDDATIESAPPAALQTAPAKLVSEGLGTPSGVTLLPGLAAVSWGPNRLDVFARATDNTIWQKWYNGTWQPWFNMGVKADSPIAVSSWQVGRIDLFFRSPADKRLHHRFISNGIGWTDDASGAIGATTIQTTALTAASWGPNRIDVFQQSPTFGLWHIWYDNGWQKDWTTENNTGGTVTSAPAATAWGSGRLDVFWKSASDGKLQHWWYSNGPHLLDPLGGEVLSSDPAVTSRGSGLLDVVYLSSTNTNTLVRRYFNQAWGSEDFDLSGASSPAVASWGPGRLDLFYLDASTTLRHVLVPSAPVVTQHNDNGRTGANLHELDLNVANVASSKFGRLFDIKVDGNVYGQTLYVPTLDLTAQNKGIRNVLYITTANNSVYMADADTGAILNTKSFLNPIPVPFGDFTNGAQLQDDNNNPILCIYNLIPQVGITSTPVIDVARNTMYVVSVRSDDTLTAEAIPVSCPPLKPTSSHTYRVQLHALDIRTLAEQSGSPVEVKPTGFDPRRQLQRPGLLLSNGAVYLGFGSYTDSQPYNGWVISYDAVTLAQKNVFKTTSGAMGGIWQAGQGLAADSAGNIYFQTGNGTTDVANGQFAMAALELTPALQRTSYFVPWNYAYLNPKDLDLGSSGIMLPPGTNYALGGGKESILYLMNRGNLGGLSANGDQVVYEDQATFANPTCNDDGGFSNIHGAPVFWQSSSGARFYIMGEEDFMRAYSLGASSFVEVAHSPTARAGCGMPGGFLSVSANASNLGSGIVWATVPTSDSVSAVVPGRVHAFNADTAAELWSADVGANDPSERFAKNNPPTVANGRVYVAAFGPADNSANTVNSKHSGKVIVYGLMSK